MKIILSILIIILVIFIVLNFLKDFKENFEINYPDKHHVSREKWFKEHSNMLKDEKTLIFNFLNKLTYYINNLFYSQNYIKIVQNVEKKHSKSKIIYFIFSLKEELKTIKDNHELNEEKYQLNEKDISLIDTLITYFGCFDNKATEEKNCEKILKDDNLSNDKFNLLLYTKFMNKNINEFIDLLKNKLFDIEFEEKTEYNFLPCLFYNKDNCPASKCQFIDNTCLPKEGNLPFNNKIDNCNALSIYGEKQCKLTKNKKNNGFCKWSAQHQKCLNPLENPKCEEIKNIDNCKDPCEVVNIDDNNKFCVTKDSNSNICLSLTGSSASNEMLKKYNCDKKQSSSSSSNIDYYNNKDYKGELECELFDKSDFINGRPKNPDEKILISDLQLLEKLCSNVLDDKGNNKCRVLKIKELYGFPSMKCVNKDLELDANFVDNEKDCLKKENHAYMGKDGNKRCINLDAECGDVKYKSVCNLKGNCFWQNSGHNDNGYCKEIDFREYDQIFNNYLDKSINLMAIEKDLNNQYSKIDISEILKKKLNKKLTN